MIETLNKYKIPANEFEKLKSILKIGILIEYIIIELKYNIDIKYDKESNNFIITGYIGDSNLNRVNIEAKEDNLFKTFKILINILEKPF